MFQKNILLPNALKIVKEEENKVDFEIDKLYPGYGHTLGNSLRRIILSSTEGVALTRVFIDGVAHEFSVIDGVKEDVINIILNLKRVVFKLNTVEDSIRVKFKVDKAGEILAKDIELPSQVEIVNKDQHLFTLSKGKTMEIEIELSKGLGYATKEEIKEGKPDVGELIIDASFTPVRRVSYSVDQTRVGDKTDYNKLSFFIETDGSVSPKEVMESSIKIMIEQLNATLGIQKSGVDSETAKSIADSIAQLDLDESILEKIAKEGIIKISELKEKTDEEILSFEGIEEKDLEEIKKSL